MTVKEAIMTLNANAVIACEKAGFGSVTVKMIEDALDTIEDALQAQKPRVMTLEEIKTIGPEDVCGIVEILEEEHMYGCCMRQYDEGYVIIACDVPDLPEKMKKGCARIWTARPTNEQREAAGWDEAN